MSRPKGSNDMELLRQGLMKARHVIIITGAGVSAESGIPTFRGEGGLWRKYQSTQLATPEAFKRDPSLVWEFYHYRRELVLSKKPNEAHLAIARLEDRLTKEGRHLTVLTQNVDGLHQAAGSRNVLEVHGSLFKTRCIPCGDIADNRDSPICEALRDRGTPDLSKDLAVIPVEQLPRCKKPGCNGLLRPHIVWFGENLHHDTLQKTETALESCDLCFVVGTSMQVYPAAGWAHGLSSAGVDVAEFNIERTSDFQFFFEGPCSKTIPQVLEMNKSM